MAGALMGATRNTTGTAAPSAEDDAVRKRENEEELKEEKLARSSQSGVRRGNRHCCDNAVLEEFCLYAYQTGRTLQKVGVVLGGDMTPGLTQSSNCTLLQR